MGYDTSYHAIDMTVVDERIIPYLAGRHDDITDLVVDAVRMAKVRFRANAWGIGVANILAPGSHHKFNSFLHVWGRPYFITADEPGDVVDAVLRYQRAQPDDVDGIVHDMLRVLDPALIGRVEPDRNGKLPGDDGLAYGFRWRLDLTRETVAAARAGRATVPHRGKDYPVAGILTELTYDVATFMAQLMPGWMDRGEVWPTSLARQAGAGWPDGFGSNAPLAGVLQAELDGVDWEFTSTIAHNYSLGGFVDAKHVSDARRWLAEHRHTLAGPADSQGYGDLVRGSLRKIDETFALAEATGAAFVEATEIYSGIEGTLN